MGATKRRLHVSKLEPIAQEATRLALENAISEGREWVTSEQEGNLTLGTFINNEICIFELYIATKNHNDALTVSRVVLDRYTGKIIGAVEVYLPPMLAKDISPIQSHRSG